MLIQRQEVTWSFDRCRPGLLGQPLLAERKYIYPMPAAHQAPAKCWAHTGYFHWEILGDPEDNVSGRRNVAQPTSDGPGSGARDTMGAVPAALCFPLGWAGADPELDRQAYTVSTPSSGFPSHWAQLEAWTEPVRKRFPGAGQQKAWVLILDLDVRQTHGGRSETRQARGGPHRLQQPSESRPQPEDHIRSGSKTASMCPVGHFSKWQTSWFKTQRALSTDPRTLIFPGAWGHLEKWDI